MEPADILEQAADVIDTLGWVRGTYMEEDASGVAGYCAIGACRKAAGVPMADGLMYELILNEEANFVAYTRAISALSVYLGKLSIAPWNDSFTRKQSDVTDALRETAKDLRNKAKP